jgi:hypothetical protein
VSPPPEPPPDPPSPDPPPEPPSPDPPPEPPPLLVKAMALPVSLNEFSREIPSPTRAAIITTAINATNIPYSMAVTPDSPLIKQNKNRIGQVDFEFDFLTL